VEVSHTRVAIAIARNWQVWQIQVSPVSIRAVVITKPPVRSSRLELIWLHFWHVWPKVCISVKLRSYNNASGLGSFEKYRFNCGILLKLWIWWAWTFSSDFPRGQRLFLAVSAFLSAFHLRKERGLTFRKAYNSLVGHVNPSSVKTID